ncbi:phosphoribosylglycinamide formyltransferase [Chloroflexota bacterium]
MYQLGWFATSRGKTSKKLLESVRDSINHGEIEAEIAFVFSNREAGEGENSDRFFELVRSYSIPLVCLSSKRFKAEQGARFSGEQDNLPRWRREYDHAVMNLLAGFHPDLCVLAGYMLIVGREMCQRYNMINLHPAAPGGPAGTWQEVIWQLIRGKARETGAMMHLVTPELDKGPVVTYCTFSIRDEPFAQHWQEIEGRSIDEIIKEGEDNPLFKLIRAYGVARELPLVIATVRAFSQGKVKITADKKVVDAEGRPINGYDLTSEIDRLVESSKEAD